MLFNSYIFVLFFLPVCVSGYFLLNRIKNKVYANLFLLGMSLWFYGYFNPSYLAIIGFSILFNYASYLLIKKAGQGRKKKSLCIASVTVNLLILGWFKYMDFFITNVNALFKQDFPLLHIVLPLGISFFTFQQLSFVIDTYRGEVGDYDFITYACYVAFFPQLVAGPIVSHDEFIPQFKEAANRHINYENLTRGLYLFILGLSKKVLIADPFGEAVYCCYARLDTMSSTAALYAIIGYSIQLYFDFSGYSDMALGIGRMFNIKLPVNFDSPYKSSSMTELWTRWHITLNRFLTRYVYIPLGGNRKGLPRTCLNIMIVFFLSGLWHGANWTFVLWGTSFGVIIVLERLFKKQLERVPKAVGTFFTFTTFTLLFVFFRSPDFHSAFSVFNRLFTGGIEWVPDYIYNSFKFPELAFLFRNRFKVKLPLATSIAAVAFSFFLLFCTRNNAERVEKESITVPKALFAGVLLTWCILSFESVSTFLYFNF